MKVIKKFSNGFIAIECGFCSGSGQFPETPYNEDNLETNPCDVCGGKGFNLFPSEEEYIVTCKCCNEEGKAYDESGIFLGEHCPVCGGKGFQDISNNILQTFEDNFWILINSKIADVSKNRFDNGNYADSVEAAFKEINSTLKKIVIDKINRELDGSALMERALSLNDPIIELDDLTTENGKNIQKGYLQIFSGSMVGIRNPKAHSNLNIEKEQAIHFIFLASLLMNKIDSANKAT